MIWQGQGGVADPRPSANPSSLGQGISQEAPHLPPLKGINRLALSSSSMLGRDLAMLSTTMRARQSGRLYQLAQTRAQELSTTSLALHIIHCALCIAEVPFVSAHTCIDVLRLMLK